MDTPRAPHHEHGSTASSLKRMRTVSDAVETERAMRHEAQEARRTAEIELQEVSAELNLLLEAASDGTDIGHDPCPRCGYHVVANPCRTCANADDVLPVLRAAHAVRRLLLRPVWHARGRRRGRSDPDWPADARRDTHRRSVLGHLGVGAAALCPAVPTSARARRCCRWRSSATRGFTL